MGIYFVPYTPVIGNPVPLGAGDSGVIAGLNCSVLTSFVLAGVTGHFGP